MYPEDDVVDYVLTILEPYLSAMSADKLRAILAGFGMRQVGEMSEIDEGPDGPTGYVGWDLAGKLAGHAELNSLLLKLANKLGADVALQPAAVFKSTRGLIVFDMDSTLIQNEVIDELAREAGTLEQVAAITKAAMNAKLPFADSLINRVALLKGLPVASFAKVKERLKLNKGAEKLLSVTRKLGMRSAIFSGGFREFTEPFQKQLGIDTLHAHELEVDGGGLLTGHVHGDIIDAEAKRILLLRIAKDAGLTPEQTVAVGDGANDIPMLKAAGLGIAYHAKPAVRSSADCVLDHSDLDSIPQLFGVGALEQHRLMSHHN